MFYKTKSGGVEVWRLRGHTLTHKNKSLSDISSIIQVGNRTLLLSYGYGTSGADTYNLLRLPQIAFVHNICHWSDHGPIGPVSK